MFVFLLQNNEYLQERLLQKGPTITERSKKVWQCECTLADDLMSIYVIVLLCTVVSGVSHFPNFLPNVRYAREKD